MVGEAIVSQPQRSITTELASHLAILQVMVVLHPWQVAIDLEWVIALLVFALDYAVVTWVLERRGRARAHVEAG